MGRAGKLSRCSKRSPSPASQVEMVWVSSERESTSKISSEDVASSAYRDRNSTSVAVPGLGGGSALVA